MDPLTIALIASAAISTGNALLSEKPGQAGHAPAGMGNNKIRRIPDDGGSYADAAMDPMQLQFKAVSK